MKESNNIDLLGYKLKIFVTRGFCSLSFLAIACVVFLFIFAFGVRIFVDLDNNICGNINSILVSIATGYLVSYFVYLLTVHIPNYSQTIVNNRIICNYLSSYRDRLLYSFGGLIYKLQEEKEDGEEKKVFEIHEIAKIFHSQSVKDGIISGMIQSTYNSKNNNLLLIKDFERLEDSFQNLLTLNVLYKGVFSREIYELQTSEWSDIISIIKNEINLGLKEFKILNRTDTQLLINQNFDLTNKAAKVNTLINLD